MDKLVLSRLRDVPFVDLVQQLIHFDWLAPLLLVDVTNHVHQVCHLILLSLSCFLLTLLVAVTLVAAERADTEIHQPECFVDVTLDNLISEVELGHCL